MNTVHIKKSTFSLYLTLIIILLFFMSVNTLMPMYSDDYSLAVKGMSEHYNLWQMYLFSKTAGTRSGTLIFQSLGLLQKPKWIFDIINTVLSFGFVIAFFMLICGRAPKSTSKDTFVLISIVFFILLYISFGETFVWMTGASSYLWPTLALTVYLIPQRKLYADLIMQPRTPATQKWPSKLVMTISIIPIAFFAGSGYQVTALIVLMINLLFLFLLLYRGEKLPVWYYSGTLALLLGFLFLHFSPGMAARGTASIKNNQGYISFSGFLHLPFIEKLKRVSIVYAIAIGKNILLSISFLVALCYIIKMPSCLLRKTLIALSLVFILSFLPWIMYLSIPDRGFMGSSLIAIAIFILCLSNYWNNTPKKKQEALFTITALTTLTYMLFITNEFYHYHQSWQKFNKQITVEKNLGRLAITDLPPIYCSHYANFVSYPGEPRKDSNFYVNFSIARLHHVKKIAVSKLAQQPRCENQLRHYFRKRFYVVTKLKKPGYLK